METKAKALPVRKAPRRFGQRKRAVCLSSSTHERGFLGDILRGSGFIVSECVTADELATLIRTKPIDLVMIGASLTEVNAQAALKALGRVNFRGEVRCLAPRSRRTCRRSINWAASSVCPCCRHSVRRAVRRNLRSRISGLLYSEGSPISPINLGGSAKSRLAGALVSAKDRCSHPVAVRSGSSHSNAPSDLGDRPAGIFYSR